MDNTNATPLKQLFQTEHSALERIFRKVQQLQQLDTLFRQYLQPHLAKHCVVANYYTDKLVVLAANASVATQVRFSSADILPRLRKHPLLKDIKSVECKVNVVGQT